MSFNHTHINVDISRSVFC